jgi:ketosteroid isomerase-like protein
MREVAGRDAQTGATLEAVDRFNVAFNRHDLDAVMASMTDDCIFESTSPPDGERHEGQKAVRAAWQAFFESSPDARFEADEIIAQGDRCIVRWVYHFGGDSPGHIRGVDVIRVRDGKVAEKLAYVKG